MRKKQRREVYYEGELSMKNLFLVYIIFQWIFHYNSLLNIHLISLLPSHMLPHSIFLISYFMCGSGHSEDTFHRLGLETRRRSLLIMYFHTVYRSPQCLLDLACGTYPHAHSHSLINRRTQVLFLHAPMNTERVYKEETLIAACT